MVHNNNLLLVAIALLLAGCGHEDARPQSIPTESLSVRKEIEAIPTWISSGNTASDRMIRLCDRIVKFPPDKRDEAIDAIKKAILSFKLPNDSYRERMSSQDSYWKAAASFTDYFCERIEDREGLWLFKCQVLNSFGKEMDLFRTNTFLNANPPRMGINLTWRSYQENLHESLFYAVRDGFEEHHFVSYFYSLPGYKQEVWLERLRKVARRDVIIWTPNIRVMPYYKRDSSLFGDDSVDFCEDGTPIRRRRKPKVRSRNFPGHTNVTQQTQGGSGP